MDPFKKQWNEPENSESVGGGEKFKEGSNHRKYLFFKEFFEHLCQEIKALEDRIL